MTQSVTALTKVLGLDTAWEVHMSLLCIYLQVFTALIALTLG